MASKGRSAVTKGKSYERKIAKTLSQAFKINVNRTAGSGNWRGIDSGYGNYQQGYCNQAENALTGDLFFPTGTPNPFSFELKCHDKFHLSNIFNNNGEYPTYLAQCVLDSRRSKHAPCLILHEKNSDDYVVIPDSEQAYQHLLAQQLPVMRLRSSYYDERLAEPQYFDMLVTNLKGLCSFTLTQLNDYYQNIQWDKHNHKQTKEELNFDELIRGIKE